MIPTLKNATYYLLVCTAKESTPTDILGEAFAHPKWNMNYKLNTAQTCRLQQFP